jgi:hypothetical protein
MNRILNRGRCDLEWINQTDEYIVLNNWRIVGKKTVVTSPILSFLR